MGGGGGDRYFFFRTANKNHYMYMYIHMYIVNVVLIELYLYLPFHYERSLYNTFASPWADAPCRPQDIGMYILTEFNNLNTVNCIPKITAFHKNILFIRTFEKRY